MTNSQKGSWVYAKKPLSTSDIQKNLNLEQQQKEQLQREQQGKYYVEMILKACEISDLPASKIQFNFCMDSMSTDKEAIKLAIEAYFNSPQCKLSAEEKSDIRKAALPENASQLPRYQTALQLRAESFDAAAKLIIDNLIDKDDSTSREKIDKLMKAHLEKIQGKQIKSKEAQAYYDAYIETLISIIQEATNWDRDKAKSELQNAESIFNMSEHKAQFTFSGSTKSQIQLQMDVPRNRFCDLSFMQQKEWIQVYWSMNPTMKGILPTWMKKDLKTQFNTEQSLRLPEWFSRLSSWEQKYWDAQMKKVMEGDENVCFGPVVKKSGLPGLRNLSISSFATMSYDKDKLDANVSPSSIRSSNLVVAYKEGKATLSIDESSLTAGNIGQILTLYDAIDASNKAAFPWEWDTARKPVVLCQTLLRMVGGGDDHVIGHKNRIAKRMKHEVAEENKKIFTSNHCIGFSKTFRFLSEAVLRPSTTSTKHVTEPVNDFIKHAVNQRIQSDEDKKELREIYKLAKKGSMSSKQLDEFTSQVTPPLEAAQITSLKRVLLALNEYTRVNKQLKGKNAILNPTQFKQNPHLHLAALEEIIYLNTGNKIQSSCKSGKDREGILKCYRNAMLAYFNETGKFPPVEEKSNERQRFIEIFITLFKSHHQARLAELNATGCCGLKALKNILPADIYHAIKEQEPGLLSKHNKNSSLNALGESKIKPDKDTYRSARKEYNSICSLPTLSSRPSSSEIPIQAVSTPTTSLWKRGILSEQARQEARDEQEALKGIVPKSQK